MPTRLRFHGAAGGVTGSMHLVEVNGRLIALDCGLFQGRRQEANLRNRSFPVPASQIEAVVLSHAHIDHCGRLPRLVHEGFDGVIYTTGPTRDLVDILLRDSAHIQEEDAAYWNKKRLRQGDEPITPLYEAADVARAVKRLRDKPMGQPFQVIPGVRATFHEAGHMLGSAMVALEVDPDGPAGEPPLRITFTGDLGRPNMEILRDPGPVPECDYLICESTYGGRVTPSAAMSRDLLAEVINQTIDHGGELIIPSFAVGRSQVLVYNYRVLLDEGKLRRAIPIVVDSPLAVQATQAFSRHPEAYDTEASAFRHSNGDLFAGDGCEYVTNVEDSKALHARPGPMIIISASGMCEVGRILHHLKNNIEDPRNTVLIVGYQAAHTLGRRLVERAPQVRIFGQMYDVRARVRVLNGFSSHANSEELVAAVGPLASRVRQAFLVHGEPDQTEALANHLRARGYANVTIPEPGDAFDLT